MDGQRPPQFLPRPAAPGGGAGPGLFKPAAPAQHQEQQPARPASQEQQLQGDGSGLPSPLSPFESGPAAGGRGKLPPPPGGFGMPHTNPLYGGASPTRTPEGGPPVPGSKRFDLENAGG